MGAIDSKDACALPQASLALDIGGTKIAGAVMALVAGAQPRIVARKTVPTEAERGGDAVLSTVVLLARELAAQADAPLCGIGVSTAGRVDANDGSIAYANEIMPGWTGQPVGAALEGAEYKHGVDAAGAGNTDYLDVGRIIQSVGACEVCAGVGTPVAAESHDFRCEFFILYLHIASTSAIICLLAKPLRSIAPDIQATVQAPQPWQTASLTEATRLVSVFPPPRRNSLST